MDLGSAATCLGLGLAMEEAEMEEEEEEARAADAETVEEERAEVTSLVEEVKVARIQRIHGSWPTGTWRTSPRSRESRTSPRMAQWVNRKRVRVSSPMMERWLLAQWRRIVWTVRAWYERYGQLRPPGVLDGRRRYRATRSFLGACYDVRFRLPK